MAKYECFFNQRRTTVEAESLYVAKQKAIQFFKPRKSQEHMVAIVLVERDDGSSVSLNNSNFDF